MSLIEPERYFSRISAIDIQKDILDAGFTHVLLDIDNTIFTRDTHEVPRDVALWLAKARSAGLAFCLVSNNWHQSVYELAGELELPIVAKAVKPLPPAFIIALRKLRARRAETLVIGDQLITDVLGAHFLGMTAYLLQPLVEQDLRHTLLLRNVEQVFMGGREPEGAAGGTVDVPSGTQPQTAAVSLAEATDAALSREQDRGAVGGGYRGAPAGERGD